MSSHLQAEPPPTDIDMVESDHLQEQILKMIRVTGDWMDGAEAAVRRNKDQFPRLFSAYNELKARESFTIPETLRVLNKGALHPNLEQTEGGLARRICSVLNHDPSSRPSFILQINPGTEIPIPSRSRLILLFLAHRLNTSIFLFSGRSKPILFRPPTPQSSVGIYHCINPLGSISTFYELIGSDHVKPRGGGESTLRVPQSVTSSSIIPAAKWREDPRIRQLGPRQLYPEISQEECMESLKKTFVMRTECSNITLESKIRAVVKTTLEKGKTKETPQSALEKAKTSTREKAISQKHVPRGSMSDAAKYCRIAYSLDDDFQEPQLQKKLGAHGNNIQVWQRIVRGKFDGIWTACVEGAPESSNDSAAAATEKHAPGIRVCTVTLKNILRSEFMYEKSEDLEQPVRTIELRQDETSKDLDRIVRTIESCQDEVTDVIDELAVMVDKLHMELAQGNLYPDELEPDPRQTFDLHQLFPTGFEFRGQVAPQVRCSPLPARLQDHIQNTPGGDIANIFNLYHLQFLYSNLMGPYTSTAIDAHPTWKQCVDLIKVSSTSNIPSAPSNIPSAPSNLNGTVMQSIHDFEIAHRNVWNGPLTKKLCDHLLRVYPADPSCSSKRMQKSTSTPRTKPRRSRAKHTMKENIRQLCDDMTTELIRDLGGRPEKIRKLLFAIQRAYVPEPTDTSCTATEEDDDDDDTESVSNRSDWSLDEELLDLPAETQSMAEDIGHRIPVTGNVGNIIDDYALRHFKQWLMITLQAICKTQLFSSAIHGSVDANWLRKSSFQDTNLTDEECRVMTNIINLLRPYVPKQGNIGTLRHTSPSSSQF
ncbi:hypothetical protein B0O80DRAFT_465434 [Mortierella sp. GBAus27b]|nr:hypothetical protein B0O80DRAFT_465434 [Mortierella sp. GBAus27b]